MALFLIALAPALAWGQEASPLPAPSPDVSAGPSPQPEGQDPSPEASAPPRATPAPVKLPAFTLGKANPSPAPYTEAEFPAWARDLRRLEIVSLGAFPLALFYAGLSWDLYRLATAKNAWTGEALSVLPWDSTLLPWPLKNAWSYKPSDDEEKLTLLTAGGLSLAIGLLDFFIVNHQRRSTRRSAHAAVGPRSVPARADTLDEAAGADPGPEPLFEAEPGSETEPGLEGIEGVHGEAESDAAPWGEEP